MSNYQCVTVYLGSSGRCRSVFKNLALALGQRIGYEKKSLVYGGMDSGLMGILANGAISTGATVTGVIPKNLKDSERIHPNLNETILVPDLWQRKLKMFKRADAVITLPGGFGTLDEAMEVLYWANLKAHGKPQILLNIENYWDDLLNYLYNLPDFEKDYLVVANSIDEVFTKLETWESPLPLLEKCKDLPHFEDEILQKTSKPLIYDTPSVKTTYMLATALGLKQLDRHTRAIGILNENKKFEDLLRWINKAQEEHFITDRCKMLLSIDENKEILNKKLAEQTHINIDLETEKWGPSETKTHIEIKETQNKGE